mmetsp:Transcript_7058/g.9962  ORF Transcript_7058/g.9962 Transcript_7058/m.9962 type:complete len:109 (-) Transcript_7058:1905-2231(-)
MRAFAWTLSREIAWGAQHPVSVELKILICPLVETNSRSTAISPNQLNVKGSFTSLTSSSPLDINLSELGSFAMLAKPKNVGAADIVGEGVIVGAGEGLGVSSSPKPKY